jgi:predicted lipid-binding transport protein (Tim44 family)
MRIGREGPVHLPDPPEAAAALAPAAPRATSGPSFAQALHGVGSAVDRGERLMSGVLGGGASGLDAGQLIALQAGIYRYSEALDLVAKLVDRASTAVKTVVSPH